jgi:hypothetical protein
LLNTYRHFLSVIRYDLVFFLFHTISKNHDPTVAKRRNKQQQQATATKPDTKPGKHMTTKHITPSHVIVDAAALLTQIQTLQRSTCKYLRFDHCSTYLHLLSHITHFIHILISANGTSSSQKKQNSLSLSARTCTSATSHKRNKHGQLLCSKTVAKAQRS